MKRFLDKGYFYFALDYQADKNGINVSCPSCGKKAIIKKQLGSEFVSFSCNHCLKNKTKSIKHYKYLVENNCKNCGRMYRVDILNKEKQSYEVLRVECPYCSFPMNGKVFKVDLNSYSLYETRMGKEPYFHLNLWYLRTYKSNLIWALNKEHLEYLCNYISADLRVDGYYQSYTTKTACDHLPTYMKLAKNRKTVLKILQDMLDE